MKITLFFGLLLILFACKEPIPEPVKTYISSPRAIVTEPLDTANILPAKPIVKTLIDTAAQRDDEVFILLPPVYSKESFEVTLREPGKDRKIKVEYTIGKDTTREYTQIFNELDIRFFSEIPLNLEARVESYISRYHTINTVKILPLIPVVTGNLFSFNLEKLQADKVYNLVIYEAGKKVHSISFEKFALGLK